MKTRKITNYVNIFTNLNILVVFHTCGIRRREKYRVNLTLRILIASSFNTEQFKVMISDI